MIKKLLVLFNFSFIFLSFFGQTADGFMFQKILRNSNGTILNQSLVALRFTIQQGNIGGTSVYEELFLSETNSNGLVSLEIGSGASTYDFSSINWVSGPYFLEIAVNFLSGGQWEIIGTSQLLSVPYAFHVNTADSLVGGLDSLEIDPVFFSSIANTITSADTNRWNNYLDTDTQLDSNDIANLGFVAGPHTIDTDTQLDSTDIANFGYVTEKTYSIGLYPELGGFVFRVSADGKHGLVCETQIQSISHSWYGCDSIIKNPAYHSLDGQSFFDWRMPTKFELNEIYLHHLTIFQVPIGGVFNYSFWTSTEYDFGKAYKQTFGVNPTPGAQGLNGKTRSGSGILSVRSF